MFSNIGDAGVVEIRRAFGIFVRIDSYGACISQRALCCERMVGIPYMIPFTASDPKIALNL